uniref:Amine oxidase n=1 Tax=Angiostrongylus cantonensis TaxID=6313 RepID=A0A0K0DNT2_ANGCA
MAPPDDRTAFPPVHNGDEVVALAYPQYKTAIVQSVIFTTLPPIGGFLHVVTIIDPLNKPFAIFFTYNLPSTGVLRLPVPTVLQGMTGRATYIDEKTAVAEQKSCKYL